jgi:hypothetical protein
MGGEAVAIILFSTSTSFSALPLRSPSHSIQWSYRGQAWGLVLSRYGADPGTAVKPT